MPAKEAFDKAENVTMFETPNGKHLKVIKILNSSLFGVRFHEGGELPAELDGAWTDVSRAVSAIKRYIDSKQKATKAKDK